MKRGFIVLLIIIMGCTLNVACRNDKKQLPISKLIDFKKQKILNATEWSNWSVPIVQNKQYVFYLNTDWDIMRIDRYTKEEIKIKHLKKVVYPDSDSVGLEISGNRLYYLYNNVVYQTNLDGQNEKQIVSIQDLNYKPDEEDIRNIKVYNNKLYFYLEGYQSIVGRLNSTTKKLDIMTSEYVMEDNCFYQNYYYYIDALTGIYRIDLKTLKKELVRGRKRSRNIKESDATVRYYDRLIVARGNLYYATSKGKGASYGGEPSKIYLYQEGGKDVMKYSAYESLRGDSEYGNDKIGYIKYDDLKIYLIIYDFTTEKEKQIHIKTKENIHLNILLDNVVLYWECGDQVAYDVMKID